MPYEFVHYIFQENFLTCLNNYMLASQLRFQLYFHFDMTFEHHYIIITFFIDAFLVAHSSIILRNVANLLKVLKKTIKHTEYRDIFL